MGSASFTEKDEMVGGEEKEKKKKKKRIISETLQMLMFFQPTGLLWLHALPRYLP